MSTFFFSLSWPVRGVGSAGCSAFSIGILIMYCYLGWLVCEDLEPRRAWNSSDFYEYLSGLGSYDDLVTCFGRLFDYFLFWKESSLSISWTSGVRLQLLGSDFSLNFSRGFSLTLLGALKKFYFWGVEGAAASRWLYFITLLLISEYTFPFQS